MQEIVAELTATELPDEVEVFTEPRVWVASGEPVKLVVRAGTKPESPIQLIETTPGRFESDSQYLADGTHSFAVGSTPPVEVGPRGALPAHGRPRDRLVRPGRHVLRRA